MRQTRGRAVQTLFLIGSFGMASLAPLARAQDAPPAWTSAASLRPWWWQRWADSAEEPARGDSGSCAEPDTRLLPDMMVDGTSLLDNALSRSCDDLPGVELCVRITVGTVNLGPGDLILTAPVGQQDAISQHIDTCGGGEVTESVETAFVDEPSHQHLHLQDWTELRLRKIDPSCDSEETAAACPVAGIGHKVSFCLTDTGVYDRVVGRDGGGLRCTLDQNNTRIVQGISAGWMDVYSRGLPGQLIDVTALDSGEYWLEVEVNPHRAVFEGNYQNNVTRTRLQLTMPQCGDGVLSAVEACDPSTDGVLPQCATLGQGFTTGTASCSEQCTLDTSTCGSVICPQQDLGATLGPAVASGTIDDGPSAFASEQCGLGAGAEVSFQWTAPATGTFVFDTTGSAIDTVLYLLDGRCDALPNIRDTCNDDMDDALGPSRVSLRMEAGETIVVVVDTFAGASGAFVLNIQEQVSPIATTAPPLPE
jgi:hypothetical protein